MKRMHGLIICRLVNKGYCFCNKKYILMILHAMRMRNFKEGVKEYFDLIKSTYINLSQFI